MPSRSQPHRPLFVLAAVLALAGCDARSITSTVGDAPNLQTWTAEIKHRKPTMQPKPLPMLADQQVFDYAQHETIDLNPNPASALQRIANNPGGGSSQLDANGVPVAQDSASVPAPAGTPSTAPSASGTPLALNIAPRAPARTLRDPFSLPVHPDSQPVNQVHPDTDRPKESLEAFPLDGLKMVGSIGDAPHVIALVQAPDKVVYHVQVGQYMGQHDGRITQIDHDHIVLHEIVHDPSGNGWTEKDTDLPLSE